MADIAAIFHWPLADLVELSIEDLAAWRERAIARWNHMHGGKGQ